MAVKHKHMNTEHDPELEKMRKKKLEEIQATAAGHSAEQPMPNAPIAVDDGNFEQLTRQHWLMVVDCWAPWCGPCHMVAPIIDELARTYAGKVVFGKLNVDENPQVVGRFGIMSIPTLLIMKRGKEVDRIIEALPKQVIEARIRKHIQ
jgi:thioredoxin 1